MVSKDLENTLKRAIDIAKEKRHEYTTLEHLLMALLDDEDVLSLMADFEINPSEIYRGIEVYLDKYIPKLSPSRRETARVTVAFQRVLERASSHAISAQIDEINGVHLLISLYEEDESYAVHFLESYGVQRFDIVKALSEEGVSILKNDAHAKEGLDKAPIKEEQKVLLEYCVNLNEKASQGKIDTLIGRQKEVSRISQILLRRTNNNPLLVGEPGVGKTALVEGMALKVEKGQVEDPLKDVVIYALDMASLMSGTRFRGDFEERLKSIVKALEDHPKKPILFVDEAHQLVGAGAVQGGMTDAANLLKPLLSSGRIQCIASTTFKEKALLEKDPPLLRRFQEVIIEEPSEDECAEIIKGIKTYYESYHKIKIKVGLIPKIVELSKNAFLRKKLPDSAIDVIDETGARLNLYRTHYKPININLPDIEETITKLGRLPDKHVSSMDRETLRNLEKNLQGHIFGQDHVIEPVADAIRLSRSGLRSKNKPIGSFLFTGPTGVGKTEVARQLASALSLPLVRFDMSEYMEKHSVSKLIGSPPGYIGFEQGGLLTAALEKDSNCVLLLDEVEKAHQDLYNVLLQVMDYGVLRDNTGKQADFRNAIIIMTSNLGAKQAEKAPIGFGEAPSTEDHLEPVRNFFSPEFRNRLDAILPFSSLSSETVKKVIKKFLDSLKSSLKEQKVSIHFSKDVYGYLGEKGFDKLNGARPLERVIESDIKKPLSKLILFEPSNRARKISVEVLNGKIHLVTSS